MDHSTPSRPYESPLRDRKKAETLSRILDAVERVVLDEGIHAFTVKNVAKRAGVAHRTVYRHFPTREALLEGLADRIETLWRDSPLWLAFPQRAEEILDRIPAVFAFFEAHADTTRAVVIISDALGREFTTRHARTAAIIELLKQSYRRLPAPVCERAGHVIRTLVGSRNWVVLTRSMQLTGQAATDAVTWAARTLLLDLEQRNQVTETSESNP